MRADTFVVLRCTRMPTSERQDEHPTGFLPATGTVHPRELSDRFDARPVGRSAFSGQQSVTSDRLPAFSCR